MKKALSLMLALTMLFTLVAIAKPAAADDEFHIGIITGSVSQSEDDRRGAEAFQAMYGEDVVKLAIYPTTSLRSWRPPSRPSSTCPTIL